MAVLLSDLSFRNGCNKRSSSITGSDHIPYSVHVQSQPFPDHNSLADVTAGPGLPGGLGSVRYPYILLRKKSMLVGNHFNCHLRRHSLR